MTTPLDVINAVRDALPANQDAEHAEQLRQYYMGLPEAERGPMRHAFEHALGLNDRMRQSLVATLNAIRDRDRDRAKIHLEAANVLHSERQLVVDQLRHAHGDVVGLLESQRLDEIARRCVAAVDVMTLLIVNGVSDHIQQFLLRIGPDSPDYQKQWQEIEEAIGDDVTRYGCDKEHMLEYVRLRVAASVMERNTQAAGGDVADLTRVDRSAEAFFQAYINKANVENSGDYAPGITDVRQRVISGLQIGGVEFFDDRLQADFATFLAKAQRHEYSRDEIRAVKILVEKHERSHAARFQSLEAIRRDTEGQVHRLDRVLNSYGAGPAHIQALEHQWLAYKVNKLMWNRTGGAALKVGALHQTTIDALRSAETYCWAPDTTQAVAGVGAGIPDDCELSPAALGDLAAPGRAGWWWFQEPVPIATTSKGPETEPIVALLWRREYPPNKTPRIWMTTLVLQAMTIDGRKQDVACPTAAFMWLDGTSLGRLPSDFKEGFTNVGFGQPLPGYDAATLDQTVDACMWCARFFMSAAMWLRQRIVVESHGTESVRAATKRIQREHKLDERPRVRVIELRRAEREMVARAVSAERDATSTGRHLKVRFVVGGLFGFTRNQWFPSTRTHAPKWIAPFWKGPENAPIKTGATVYAVRR